MSESSLWAVRVLSLAAAGVGVWWLAGIVSEMLSGYRHRQRVRQAIKRLETEQ